MRRPLLIPLLLAVALAAGGAPAGAAAPPQHIDIGVAPSKLQMRLVPGQVSHTSLDVFNKADTPTILDVYFNDYTISSASAVQFLEPGSMPGSAAPWSTLDMSVVRMPAHSHRRVELTVRVPDDAALGTHTLAVVFRSREARSSGDLKYRPAVASLLAAGVQNADGSGLVLKGSAVVRNVDVRWLSVGDVIDSSDKVGAAVDWLLHPTVVAHVEVRNEGNTFFNILKGGTTFHTRFALGGRGGETMRAPTYTILPDSVRTVDATWKDAPWAASGEARVKLYYNDTSAIGAAPLAFTIIPWHLIVTAGLLLLLLLGFVITRRRRSRRGRVRVETPSPWLKAGV